MDEIVADELRRKEFGKARFSGSSWESNECITVVLHHHDQIPCMRTYHEMYNLEFGPMISYSVVHA